MSIAEYQVSLKNLIDATTDETILKKWKIQLEADLEQRSEKMPDSRENTSLNAPVDEPKSDTKNDTSNFVVIASGLGIDE
ncbi:MAG TPA: hypothetical protein VEY10_02940 [Flavisolibacter sp.]|jgi:hypothetical protein|nr:hypothetical protein [Flavisolibacter sp.]